MDKRLYTCWDNTSKAQSVRFLAADDDEATDIAARMLECRKDDVALVFETKDIHNEHTFKKLA